MLSFVFWQDSLFLHDLTTKTNNKALIQKTWQHFDMSTYVIAVLSYFPATLSWNKTYNVAALTWNMTLIEAALRYFPANLGWNMTLIVAALSYFPATLTWKITHMTHISELLSSSSELKHLTNYYGILNSN